MLEIPSRQDLAELSAKTNAVVSAATLGFARPLDDNHVSVLYWTPNGIGEHFLQNTDLPDVLLPSATDMRQADAKVINSSPNGVFEWHLLVGEVQRVVSFQIRGCNPAVRFWVGSSDPAPLTKDQQARIESIADGCADLLKGTITRDAIVERLRRLEMTAELLPAIVQVLDVREVFDRLSGIARKALS